MNASMRNMNAVIPRGACIVLTGASGCGKTTFTRCVNNLIPEFYEGTLSGSIEVLGENITTMGAGKAGQHIASVFQDPRTQFFTTDSTAEVAFACENYGMPVEDMHVRVQAAFRRLNIEHLEGRSVFALSSGERQKVAIASAWALGADMFVFDEPSANLDAHSIAHLRDILQSLKAEGRTLLISEHRLYYLKDIADALWVIEDGEQKEVILPEEINRYSPDQWSEKGLRQTRLANIRLKNAEALRPLPFRDNPVELAIRNLSFQHRSQDDALLKDVSLNAQGGEVVAISGENGSGKTTLGKLIAGLIRGCGKSVSINGAVCKRNALNRDCYFVMQEADHQLYTDSVESELMLGCDKKDTATQEKMKAGLQMLGLADWAQAHPCSLSGGQKQRLTVLCAALSQKPVVILDEPTSGLDYANMRAIARLIHQMRAEGRLVFVISHDLEFLSLVCNRACILEGGRISADFRLRDQQDFTRLVQTMLSGEKEVHHDVDTCIDQCVQTTVAP